MMGKSVSVFLLAVISTGAHALGLGSIQLNSNLNQPLDARIELLSPTQAELDSLTISLADGAAFSRAGIEYVPLLTGLRFQVIENETGPDYIRITSREPVREPYLNFLLQANWSNGRLYREYTVLLDPPLYDPNAGRVASGAAAVDRAAPAAQEPAAPPSARQTPSPAGSTAPAPARAVTPAPAYSGSDYGPVSNNESLWSIANRVRPDDTISTQQMMLALLRANPEAFIDNNINGLRQGQILRVPERDEIGGSSLQQAFTEVRSQNAAWEEMRGALAGAVATRPMGPGTQPAGTGTSSAGAGGSSELRLVAPGNEAQGGGQSGAAAQTAAGENYALMDEQLQALGSENAELRSRLQESEALIDDLRRLIELKDDELATLQQQAAGFPGEQAAAGTDPDTASGDTGMTGGEEADMADTAQPPQPAEPVTPRVETTAPAPAPAPAMPPATTTPQQPGLVDQALGFIQGNMLMIGGAAGGIALAVLLLLFVRNRRAAPPEEDYPEAEFDRLEATVDETEMPQDEDLAAPAEADTAIFIGEEAQPEAPHETAADAAAEEPEAPPAAGQEAGEDPLAEVNVFLAYEHFDQAEEFVREAIAREPDNLDFHGKLLEVFYSSGDKAKYEEEARVLQELTGGEGPHWDMALIMWQEMSPSRALFAEGAGDEAEESPREDVTTGRGIVDLTADEDAGDEAELDFDLGIGAGGGQPGQDRDEGLLDLTASLNDDREDVLDVTASEPRQEPDEDLLDITAAVGLDRLDEDDHNDMLDGSGNAGDDLLDVTAHADLEADSNEDLLDLTAAGKAGDDNSLDFNIGGLEQALQAEETAGAADDDNVISFESETAGGGPGEDFGLSLDAGSGEPGDDFGLSRDKDEDVINLESDGGIELDLESGGQDEPADISLAGEDDFGIELGAGDDTAGGEQDFGLSLEGEEADQDNPALELESTLKLSAGGDDGDYGLSLEGDETDSAADPVQELESTLKLSAGGDGEDFGLSLDEGDSGADESGLVKESTLKLSLEDGDGDYGISLDEDGADTGLDTSSSLKLSSQDGGDGDLSIEEEEGDTIKLTGRDNGLSLDDEVDEDEDDDHTVFVPRTADAREQSAEDESATKLDLAKAYVELGDNDSAKAILEEVIADGTEKQRRQAQDLLEQIA